MSGLEVAGVVLGGLPLIISALTHYNNGLQVSKRYSKYRTGLRALITQVETEHIIYTNTLEQLLAGILSSEQMATFLRNPNDKIYGDAETVLGSRLGQTYEPFCNLIVEMHQTLQGIQKKLALDHECKACQEFYAKIHVNVIQPQFSDPNRFKEEYRRLRFTIKISSYEKDLARLRACNQALSQLVNNTVRLRDLPRRFEPDLNLLRNSTCQLYDTLQSLPSSTFQNAAVNLRLESRNSSGVEGTDQLSDMTFFAIFVNSSKTTQSIKAWRAVRLQWLSTPPEESSSGQKHSAQTQPSQRLGVRFADSNLNRIASSTNKYTNITTGSTLTETIPTPEEAIREPRPVHDFWGSLLSSPEQQGDTCAGYLFESSKRKLCLHPVPFVTNVSEHQDRVWSAISLRQALSKTAELTSYPSRIQKLKVAVALAWGVLQFSNTPWLANDWNEDDIHFIDQTNAPSRSIYEYPFLHYDFSKTTIDSRTQRRHISHRIVRNESIFTLGIVLLELCYGKMIEELQLPSDVMEGEPGPVWSTAHRVIEEELEYEAGKSYSDAAKRCIRCDFDCRSSSLSDEALQRAFYRGVIIPLEETLNFYTGEESI
jgi:hypothetical protein